MSNARAFSQWICQAQVAGGEEPVTEAAAASPHDREEAMLRDACAYAYLTARVQSALGAARYQEWAVASMAIVRHREAMQENQVGFLVRRHDIDPMEARRVLDLVPCSLREASGQWIERREGAWVSGETPRIEEFPELSTPESWMEYVRRNYAQAVVHRDAAAWTHINRGVAEDLKRIDNARAMALHAHGTTADALVEWIQSRYSISAVAARDLPYGVGGFLGDSGTWPTPDEPRPEHYPDIPNAGYWIEHAQKTSTPVARPTSALTTPIPDQVNAVTVPVPRPEGMASAPSSEDSQSIEEWPVIAQYSRKQALDDGFLVDLTEWASASKGFHGGFTIPVACTVEVWNDITSSPKGEKVDERGRAHDVLFMASLAARSAKAKEGNRVLFSVIMPVGRTRKQSYVLVIGPGDAGEPVLTIMQPGQD